MNPLNLGATGVANRRRLTDLGIGRHRIESALRSGELTRLRTNWYATSDAMADVVAAVSAGGALTGPHLLSHFGGWVPAESPLHILSFGHRSAAASNVVRHFGPGVPSGVLGCGVVTWQVALAHSLGALDCENAVALVDALLHMARQRTWATERRGGPSAASVLAEVSRHPRGREILGLVDAEAESGPESIVRVRLRLLGHEVRIQYRLENRQRMDVVIDGIVGLEIDGRHHAERVQYVSDHRKAGVAAKAGLIPLRFTVRQVLAEWDSLVYPAIVRMLRVVRDAEGSWVALRGVG